MIEMIFYNWLIEKYYLYKHIFLTFYFYRQVINKWNSRLSIWVILDLWSLKVKNIDKKALKKSTQKYWFFLLLHENVCCGYSLEVPHGGASNEYPQHIFSWRNKKNIIDLEQWISASNEYPQHIFSWRNKKNIIDLEQWISTWKRDKLRVNIFSISQLLIHGFTKKSSQMLRLKYHCFQLLISCQPWLNT